jgi:putative protease
LKKGDTICIEGPTTGEEVLVLEDFLVNKTSQDIAKNGDKVTFKTNFRIRKSDEVYKIVKI